MPNKKKRKKIDSIEDKKNQVYFCGWWSNVWGWKRSNNRLNRAHSSFAGLQCQRDQG